MPKMANDLQNLVGTILGHRDYAECRVVALRGPGTLKENLMRNLTIGLVIVASMALAGPALAQNKMDDMHKMGDHKMQGHKMKMSAAYEKVMKCMMTGISKDEMNTLHKDMGNMSKAEHAVMMKRGRLCMADPHTALKNMKGQPTDAQVHEHMMSGLTKSEQMTMNGMMKKMSPKDMAICKKMVENCCMYGMKHAK